MPAVNTDLARTAAALILVSNPTIDQVTRAITGIRNADAIDAREANAALRAENAKLRVEAETLRRVLALAAGPDQVLRALDIIEFGPILDRDDEQ
jgi:hypothetical protein